MYIACGKHFIKIVKHCFVYWTGHHIDKVFKDFMFTAIE